jgi:NAD(P)-dependent dehydrogenase (short-subunit alcohol dehydrogenase family)
MAHWLVTGGLGFIGSAFVRLVLRERTDVSVTVLDAMTYAANPANVAEVAHDPRYSFVRGDIADAARVDEAIGEGVDAIVNFAAETHVENGFENDFPFRIIRRIIAEQNQGAVDLLARLVEGFDHAHHGVLEYHLLVQGPVPALKIRPPHPAMRCGASSCS